MNKALRLSEKWFQRGLWLVALVFASFLVGLGQSVVGDLPHVEQALSTDSFIDKPAAARAQAVIDSGEKAEDAATEALQQASLKYQTAHSDSSAAHETLDNWLRTRGVTGRADQDPELIARSKALDVLATTERNAKSAMEQQQQVALDARQSKRVAQAALDTLSDAANDLLGQAQRAQELRVFGYRLALTLPLLLIAGWLFAKKRKSPYWPFVWGFIYFALFAFFVELVPYMPSYGGYVRYAVGIVLTVIVGRQAIVGLNRYLEQQKLAEALPDAQRRGGLNYDVALGRLAKSVCPSCERRVDLKNNKIDFCPDCGIKLFDHCEPCDTRKSAFAKFCHACGVPAHEPAPAVEIVR